MNRSISIYAILLWMVVLTGCANNSGDSKEDAKTETKNSMEKSPAEEKRTIVFLGNSLTAGYGLDPSQAFPALIQKKIDSMGLLYKVVNAGVSGETSSGGLGRISWILRQPIDIFVLELGANDGLRGIPVAETRKNLQAMIDSVASRYPAAKIMLAGMQIPPNMGATYASQFRELFPDLAKHNKITLIPFLLEGVGGEARFNQQDGVHPTAEGQAILAENVWKYLQPLL